MSNDPWLPWTFLPDDGGIVRRVSKDLTVHPVVLELCGDQTYVGLARNYAWSKVGPTAQVNDGTNWPPGTSPREGVANYWHATMSRARASKPDLVPDVDTFEALVAQAKSVAQANPLGAW